MPFCPEGTQRRGLTNHRFHKAEKPLTAFSVPLLRRPQPVKGSRCPALLLQNMAQLMCQQMSTAFVVGADVLPCSKSDVVPYGVGFRIDGSAEEFPCR